MFARHAFCISIAMGAAWLATSLPASAQNDPVLSDIVDSWLASPHADRTAEAFTHWDKEGEVPENCAACHSGPGFLDFTGADASAAGVVDHPAPIGSPIDCVACHNGAAAALDTVRFPSGEEIGDLGSSAICMVCHQGRSSTDTVNAALEGAESDTVSADLAFFNIHYRAAAATLLGGIVRGGYQYEGKDYAGRFDHVPSFDTCTECHEPHSTKVAATQCTACHKDVDTPRAIRSTPLDIDGDGDTVEGVAGEIETLHDRLNSAIQIYAAEVAGVPIVYASGSYPYFFTDTNADGVAGTDEATYPNRYQSWTPRLLKAAYNYQFVAKDPGAYAHNPAYAIQLLTGSLESLSEKVDID